MRIEIVAYAPSEFFHCMHCEFVWGAAGVGRAIHAEQRASSLPSDLAEQYDRIGQWVQGLVERHGAKLDLRIVDAASPEGLFKALRHRLWRFPAVIVDGKAYSGSGDLSAVTAAVERALQPDREISRPL
jgi:hypothetical protein